MSDVNLSTHHCRSGKSNTIRRGVYHAHPFGNFPNHFLFDSEILGIGSPILVFAAVDGAAYSVADLQYRGRGAEGYDDSGKVTTGNRIGIAQKRNVEVVGGVLGLSSDTELDLHSPHNRPLRAHPLAEASAPVGRLRSPCPVVPFSICR